MGFKENIKNRRLELNLTLQEVSSKLGISKPTLQRYESGVIDNIPFDKVEKLANILNTTPSQLMGWNDTQLTDTEKNLLEKYNSLDYMGKHAIDVVLEIESNRCQIEKLYKCKLCGNVSSDKEINGISKEIISITDYKSDYLNYICPKCNSDILGVDFERIK